MYFSESWRQHGRDRADAALLRRAATGLRDDPEQARRAGLVTSADGAALAAVLDLLAAELPHLDPVVRWRVVGACRTVLGDAAPVADRRQVAARILGARVHGVAGCARARVTRRRAVG